MPVFLPPGELRCCSLSASQLRYTLITFSGFIMFELSVESVQSLPGSIVTSRTSWSCANWSPSRFLCWSGLSLSRLQSRMFRMVRLSCALYELLLFFMPSQNLSQPNLDIVFSGWYWIVIKSYHVKTVSAATRSNAFLTNLVWVIGILKQHIHCTWLYITCSIAILSQLSCLFNYVCLLSNFNCGMACWRISSNYVHPTQSYYRCYFIPCF